MLIGVDVAALRHAGLLDRLAGSKELESSDYREFVRAVRFDYREDLDYVLLGMADSVNYFLLRGRFDWVAITAYSKSQGGNCETGLCSLAADTGKNISYFAKDRDLVAIAVGGDARGATKLQADADRPVAEPAPDFAVWARVRKSILDNPSAAGDLAGIVTLFQGANQVDVDFAAEGPGVVGRLTVSCPSQAIAQKILAVLDPARAQTSLMAGAKLRVDGSKVRGEWSPGPELFRGP